MIRRVVAANTKALRSLQFARKVTAFAFLSALSISALAKDRGVLERIAYAAFLADQGSAVCASARLDFSSEDAASFRDSKGYAQRIKQQIISGLSEEEGRSVLIAAADRAKNEAREATAKFRSEADMQQWCTSTVAPFVRQVLGDYANNRAVVDELIRKAKTD
jgi:hypothetical protein